MYFHLRDSADGTSKTGLLYNSSGAVASYVRNGAARSAITLATLASASAAHADGGFIEVDGTNAKGLYRLDVPDAAFLTGVDSLVVHIGFTGVYEESLYIQLKDNTNKDIYDIVNHGTYGNAQLVRATTPANTLDIEAGGTVGIDWGNVANQATSVDLSATAINLCDTVTTNTDMRGTDSALLAASAPTNFGDLAITVTTGEVTVGTNNDKTGYSISGTKTTLDALNDVSTAQVNAEVDTALADINLDHLVGTATGIPAVPAGTFLDQIMDDGTATYDRTTDSLQAIRDRGDTSWLTGSGGS
ncbi:MAG: hypothetical protein R3330_13710, partial [Saprospiraceae bacterium]|nr:hypothetical protein [Saprospiraceae bacterium]